MRTILPLLLLFLLSINCSEDPSTSLVIPDPKAGDDLDPGYRVAVRPVTHSGEVELPSHGTDWTLEYKFVVPPKPTANWDYTKKTVYTYGQVSFDRYGSLGPDSTQISGYKNNQIVPQVMIGNCLDSNDSRYRPHWGKYQDWVIQAQYFWLSSADTPYALCGNIVHVSVGAELTTTISYSASTGAITASISGIAGTSTIIVDKPFLNDSLFVNWNNFFAQAELKSQTSGPYGNAVLNVETHYVDSLTICSMLPFNVNHISIPGIAWANGNYHVAKIGEYTCQDPQANKLAILHY